MVLTEQYIRGVEPPSKGQKLYRCENPTGFALRVSQGGAKTYVLIYGPERQFITIGRHGVIGLSQARTEAKRLLAEFTLGKIRPQTISYPEAVELFLAEKTKSRRAGTVKDLRQRLYRHFDFKRAVADISHQELARRLSKIKPNSEHDHALAVAKTFFTWCYNRRYITDNPVRGLSPHGHTSRSRVLTDAELLLIWRACEQTGDGGAALTLETAVGSKPDKNLTPPRLPAHFATIVKLLIATGQRRGEIAALRKEFICTDTITLPSNLTKNGREHTFPLSALTASLLKAQKEKSSTAFLFPARGSNTTPFNGWSKAKAQLDQLSGVKDWTLHDLRRTYRTTLGRLGVMPHIAERLVNHVSAQTDMERVYDLNRYMPEMQDAVARHNQHLSQLLAGAPTATTLPR